MKGTLLPAIVSFIKVIKKIISSIVISFHTGFPRLSEGKLCILLPVTSFSVPSVHAKCHLLRKPHFWAKIICFHHFPSIFIIYTIKYDKHGWASLPLLHRQFLKGKDHILFFFVIPGFII